MKSIFTYLYIVFGLLFCVCSESYAQTDNEEPTDALWNYVLPKEIYQSVSDCNAVSLATYFNSSVEVSMPQGTSNIYSRKQAEVVMTDFFSLVRNSQFVVEHEQSMSASTMTIGSLMCDNATYKIFILTQPLNNQVVIRQIRVERF